jgi:hypothetical protein
MALYSVHLRGNVTRSVADAAFVCQAFSWKAFSFGPLWLLSHRLWAGFALWIIAYTFLIAASVTVISAWAGVLIALALQILLGLEANRLREVKLAKQGFRLAEIIAAPALDQAEIAFYRQSEAADNPRADTASTSMGGAGS